MLLSQAQEGLLISEVTGSHDVMRVLLVPSLLVKTDQTPAEHAGAVLALRSSVVILNLLHEGTELWRI